MPTLPPPSPFADGALTVAAAVKEFAIHRKELYRLMREGHLSYAVRPSGRGRLIPRASLVRYLESLQQVKGDY